MSEDALRQGRVDAVNMNQPFAARAEAKGGTRKLFSLSEAMPNIVHILEACRADFVDKNPEVVKAYVRDITPGMKKALANREETLKVVSEQLKAPIPVLETYLLKDNDFGRDPGAAPNFPAIQKMLDIYAETGNAAEDWMSRSSSTRPSWLRCSRRLIINELSRQTPGTIALNYALARSGREPSRLTPGSRRRLPGNERET